MEPPLVCMMDAIPVNERGAHFALAAKLFGRQTQERRKAPNGYAFRFPPDTLEPLARFVSKEQRCCPFLSFTITVTPNSGPVWLEIAGPDRNARVSAGRTSGHSVELRHSRWPNGAAPSSRPPWASSSSVSSHLRLLHYGSGWTLGEVSETS